MGKELEPFYGKYLGFAPTDESPIAMGELEITIDDKLVHYRHATGLKIDENEFSSNLLTPMTREETSIQWQNGSEYAEKCVGFDVGGLKYLFLPNDEDLGLIIKGNELADILGPTFLFGPEQLERGLYNEMIKEMKEEFGGECYFPMLSYGGKMPDEYYTSH